MKTQDILKTMDLGAGALARGDRQAAKGHFLQAARDLLALARLSQGEPRRRWMAQANRIMRHAQQVGGDEISPPAGGAPETTAAGPECRFEIRPGGSLRLDDVAGAEEVKRAFRAKFIYPLRNPALAARYKQSGSGGLLLYGPPGTGKTLLVRALAGEMGAPVYIIKPSEILSKWLGEAEQNLAALFQEASRHPVSLIFIDEIDALAPARGNDPGGVMERLVPQLLAELDGFEKRQNRVLFLGATNEPESLDPAIMRPGRFDELCYVGLPDAEARHQILQHHLEGVPLGQDVDLTRLAATTEGHTGAELLGLCLKATQAAYTEAIETGNERPVAASDFERALARLPRGVTPEVLEKYRRFGERGSA